MTLGVSRTDPTRLEKSHLRSNDDERGRPSSAIWSAAWPTSARSRLAWGQSLRSFYAVAIVQTLAVQVAPEHESRVLHETPPWILDDSAGVSARIVSRLKASPLALLPLLLFEVVVFFIVVSL
jgi:hypothetical protein